jgi:hypothetical protein
MPRYEIINLDLLVLDPNNPRLPKSKQGSEDESEILKYMLTDSSLIELMLAIGENDFFPGEQLLVTPIENDKYKVVEGNRRLSALKLLNNPSLVEVHTSKIEKVLAETTFRPTEIPCLVFDTENEIFNYLGYRHITGIKEWKLLEKARYLYGLKTERFNDISLDAAAKEIAKIIGSKTPYVKRILIGFEVYKLIEDEDFFQITDLNDVTFYFNYIADSLNKSNIANLLGVDLNALNPLENINIDNLRKWAVWLFQKDKEGRTRIIGDSYDLTALNNILGHEEAKIAFMDSGYSLERALELTNPFDSQFVNFVRKAVESLEQADRIVLKALTFSETTKNDLRTLRSLSSKIYRTIQEKEDEEDDN